MNPASADQPLPPSLQHRRCGGCVYFRRDPALPAAGAAPGGCTWHLRNLPVAHVPRAATPYPTSADAGADCPTWLAGVADA